MSKPIVIFTNFNDAFSLISNNDLLITHEKKLYRVFLNNNFDILSITLPLKDKKYKGKQIKTLNCLIPTIKLLVNLQTHNNWSKFIDEYKNILKERKNKILSWINSLEDNRVYLCCCVETTVNGIECHRRYLYDIFSNGIVKDKAIWIYRNGINKITVIDDDINVKKEFVDENFVSRSIVYGMNVQDSMTTISTMDSIINFKPASRIWNGNIVSLETESNISNIYPGDIIYVDHDGVLTTNNTGSGIGIIESVTSNHSNDLENNIITVRLNDNFLKENEQLNEMDFIDDL